MLGSGEVVQFLYAASRTHFDAISTTVEQMVRSSRPDLARKGASVLTFASNFRPALDALVDGCLTGSEDQKLGVVELIADNVASELRRDRSVAVLAAAFDDENATVRQEASRAFWRLEGQALEPYRNLFESFAESRSFSDDASPPLHLLERSVSRLPETGLRLCERFTEVHGLEMGDMATRAAGDAREVAQTVLRLRVQTSESGRKVRCLDVIDSLVRYGAIGIDDTLNEMER